MCLLFHWEKCRFSMMNNSNALIPVGLPLYKYSLIRCFNKRLVFVFEMKIIRLYFLFLPTPSSTFDPGGGKKGVNYVAIDF